MSEQQQSIRRWPATCVSPMGTSIIQHSWEGVSLGGRKVILSLSKQVNCLETVKTDEMLLHLPCNSHSGGFSSDAAPVLKVPARFLQPGGMISPHCPALWCATLRKEGPFRRKYCFHLLMYSTHIRQSSCLYSGRSSPIFVINTLQSQH